MNSQISEIIFQIFKILIFTLSAIGGLFCVYIFGGFIFRNKSSLYIKGNTYLILDVDEIGEKLEYYVRKIETDIADRYIYISKIILYSKTLSRYCKKDINKKEAKETEEIFKICKILAETYGNIIFLNDNTTENSRDILSFL